MTGSYSEILSPSRFKIEPVPEEDVHKPSIKNLAIEGTVLKEGDMIHFIAKILETKIRLSSPDISGNIFLLLLTLHTHFVQFLSNIPFVIQKLVS